MTISAVPRVAHVPLSRNKGMKRFASPFRSKHVHQRLVSRRGVIARDFYALNRITSGKRHRVISDGIAPGRAPPHLTEGAAP